MLTEQIDQERCLRFYQWALADAEQGVYEQYSLLREIQNVDVVNYLRTVEGMTTEEQLHLARALVKRSHWAARNLLRETLSAEEQALIEDYRFDIRLKESAIQQEFYEKNLKARPYRRAHFIMDPRI